MNPEGGTYCRGVGFLYETTSDFFNVLSSSFTVTIHSYAYKAPYSHNFIAGLPDYVTIWFDRKVPTF